MWSEPNSLCPTSNHIWGSCEEGNTGGQQNTEHLCQVVLIRFFDSSSILTTQLVCWGFAGINGAWKPFIRGLLWAEHLVMSSPVTRKSVKIRRQQQQKLTGLQEAASDGRKRKLQASLHQHNTTAPSNAPSMAATEQTQHLFIYFILKYRFFLLPHQARQAQECQALV